MFTKRKELKKPKSWFNKTNFFLVIIFISLISAVLGSMPFPSPIRAIMITCALMVHLPATMMVRGHKVPKLFHKYLHIPQDQEKVKDILREKKSSEKRRRVTI